MLVILESPYAGNIDKNVWYARKCLRHSLLLGESPFASHLLYTQDGVLDDSYSSERLLGINAGLRYYEHAKLSAVYTDLGISDGMLKGIEIAKMLGVPICYRKLF